MSQTDSKLKFNCRAYEEYEGELRDRVNAEMDRYGFFAFNDRQFDEGMDKLKRTLPEGFKLYQTGGGYFVWTEKWEYVNGLVSEPKRLLAERMEADHDFARGAFLSEMMNHEFAYNTYQGWWDVCECFNPGSELEFDEGRDYRDYLGELGYSEAVIECCRQAAVRYWRMCEENGWW